mgnify:CR=1 FL=1
MKEYDYKNAMDKINIPQNMQKNLLNKLTNKKERFIMKKKSILIAAAACLCIGSIAFAAGNTIFSRTSGSSSIPEYKKLPTAEECMKDVGYVPYLIESFDNGYTFSGGHIVKNSNNDENGKSVEKFQSFNFIYEKDGNRVYFSEKKFSSADTLHGEQVTLSNGAVAYYADDTYKFVPPDYELTEEDKKAEKNGELTISYGSDEVEYSQIRSFYWAEGDMHYGLMQTDGELAKDDFTKMAEEIIK